MGVMSAIAGAKKSFKQYRTVSKGKRFARELKAYEKEKSQLERENRELTMAKQRRDELERLRTQRAKLTPVKENKLKSVGKGLAMVINKGKSGVASAKKQGFLQGANFDPGARARGDTFSGSSGSPFGGSRSIEVGGSGLGFGKAQPEKKEKPRGVTIKVM